MADYIPKFLPGAAVPITLTASVIGGQLVTTAGTVAGDAAVNVAGVASADAPAGATITVFRLGIQRLTASTAVTNGQPYCAAANGAIRTWVPGTDAVAAYLGCVWSTAAAGSLADAALYAV